jgi:hypothetical protein
VACVLFVRKFFKNAFTAEIFVAVIAQEVRRFAMLRAAADFASKHFQARNKLVCVKRPWKPNQF